MHSEVGQRNSGFSANFQQWQNYPLPWGIWIPYNRLYDSLGPSELTTQTASRSVQPYCTDHRKLRPVVKYRDTFKVSLYFTTGRPSSPFKIPPSYGRCGSPFNTWLLRPTRSSQTASPSVPPFCKTHYCDRHSDRQTTTDHATRSVTIGCIYVRSTAMRLNNKTLV